MPSGKKRKDEIDDNDLIAMDEIRQHEGGWWVARDEEGDWYVTSKSSNPNGGTHLVPYSDSKGYETVGYGHLVLPGEKFPDQMTPDQAESLLQEDYLKHKKHASNTPGWGDASPRQKRAMINLTFNMGAGWHKDWPGFTEAAKSGDFNRAADELVNSKWYSEVGTRAPDVVNLMRPDKKEPVKVAGRYRGGGLIRDAYGRTLI